MSCIVILFITIGITTRVQVTIFPKDQCKEPIASINHAVTEPGTEADSPMHMFKGESWWGGGWTDAASAGDQEDVY